METTVSSRELTDKSNVYSVVFVDGSNIVEIDCIDEQASNALQEALSKYALNAQVYS